MERGTSPQLVAAYCELIKKNTGAEISLVFLAASVQIFREILIRFAIPNGSVVRSLLKYVNEKFSTIFALSSLFSFLSLSFFLSPRYSHYEMIEIIIWFFRTALSLTAFNAPIHRAFWIELAKSLGPDATLAGEVQTLAYSSWASPSAISAALSSLLNSVKVSSLSLSALDDVLDVCLVINWYSCIMYDIELIYRYWWNIEKHWMRFPPTE